MLQTQQLREGPGTQVSLLVTSPSLSAGSEVWERVGGFGGSGKMPRIWNSIIGAERTGQDLAGGSGAEPCITGPSSPGHQQTADRGRVSLGDRGHEAPRADVRAGWRLVRLGSRGGTQEMVPVTRGHNQAAACVRALPPPMERREMQRGRVTVTDTRAWRDPWGRGRRRQMTAQGWLARALAAQHIARRAEGQANWFADNWEGERRGDPHAEPQAGCTGAGQECSEVTRPRDSGGDSARLASGCYLAKASQRSLPLPSVRRCSRRSQMSQGPPNIPLIRPQTSPSSGNGGRCLPEFCTLIPLSRLTVGGVPEARGRPLWG